ncbi:MAG: response regulator [Candidatus Omnitrophica bacterium]|nr:response regulator [Candidatus Omnitrophota bacterium]
MHTFFTEQMDYIFFIYGLAFFLLSVVCLLLRQQSRTTIPWHWLGLFGLIHGVNEWLDMLAIALGDNAIFQWSRLVIMAVSFICLMEFGRSSCQQMKCLRLGRWVYVLLLALALPNLAAGMPGLNAGLRYALGLLGGLWTAWAMAQVARREERGGAALRWAAALMAAYAVAAGLVTPKAAFFPAAVLNHDSFLKFAHFPIQLVRGLLACGIALFVGIYREEVLADARSKTRVRSLLAAVAVVVLILASGWFLADWTGRQEETKQRDLLISMAQQTALTIDTDKLKELTATDADRGSWLYQRLKTKLMTMRGVLADVRFMYLMRRAGDQIVFLADSEKPGSQDESPPGQVYYEASPAISEVFTSGKVQVEGPVSDRWGSWVSGYAPLFNGRTGEVLAVLGVDRSASDYRAFPARERLKVIGLMAVLCLAALLAFAYHLRYGAFLSKLSTGLEVDRLLQWGTAGIVILIGLSLTAFAFFKLRSASLDAFETTFMQRAVGRANVVAGALEGQGRLMDGLRSLFMSSDEVERAEFSYYARSLIKGVPVQAVEWIPKVPDAERSTYEDRARRELGRDFFITEKVSDGKIVPAKKRDEYFPVYYLEPLFGNGAALGFDMASEPVRKAAMEKARDTGQAVATAPMGLVQQPGEMSGVLLFMPVYGKGAAPQNVEERRHDLRGFVLGVYNATEFLKTSFSRMPAEGLVCLVEDMGAVPASRVLYRHVPRLGKIDWEHLIKKFVMPIDMADREWRITIAPGTAFIRANLSSAYLLWLPAGILLTAVLAFYLNMLMLSRYRAEQLVRRRTAELRQREESYHRQFLDNSAAMLLVDPSDGAILEANRAAGLFYGYPDAYFKKMRISDINVLPTAQIQHAMEKVMSGAERRFEFRHRLQNGAVRDVEVSSSPVLFNGRMVLHSIIHDITERKTAEKLLVEARLHLEEEVRERTEELKQANAELRIEIEERQEAIRQLQEANRKADEASRLKSQFVATVSHEMRTPLNGIIGFAELLENVRDPERIREMSRTIVHESEILLGLVNDILDRAKIEAGKLVLNWEVVDIRVLVDRLCKPFELRLAGAAVKLVVDIAEDVPRAFISDRLRIGQVMTNLLNNAVKFTPQGSVTLKIEKTPGTGGRTGLRFSVIDTGVGIPAEKQHLIFQRFAQVDGELSRRFGGVGLGVSIAKGLVELMGGEIGFESCVGSGTTFWFTLEVDTTDAPAPYKANEVALPVGHNGSGRVLVAEDYPPNQEIVRMHLEGAGYAVQVVGDGQTALDLCSLEEFRLILMDIQMPDMDGYEATRRMRERGGWLKDVPILGFTANADNKTFDECLAIGMNGVIVKPIRREAFLAEIGKWLQASRPQLSQVTTGKPETAIGPAPAAVMDYEAAVREFGGNVGLLKEVARRFLLQARQQMDKMTAALVLGDAASIGSEGHKIKGASANLTAMRLAKLAGEVESRGKAGNLDGMAGLLEDLRRELAALDEFINKRKA